MRKLTIAAALVFAALAIGAPSASAGVLPGPIHRTGASGHIGPIRGGVFPKPPVPPKPKSHHKPRHHRTVVAAPTVLAFTGVNMNAYLALSGSLLLVGGALVRVGRRRATVPA